MTALKLSSWTAVSVRPFIGFVDVCYNSVECRKHLNVKVISGGYSQTKLADTHSNHYYMIQSRLWSKRHKERPGLQVSTVDEVLTINLKIKITLMT